MPSYSLRVNSYLGFAGCVGGGVVGGSCVNLLWGGGGFSSRWWVSNYCVYNVNLLHSFYPVIQLGFPKVRI